VFSHIFIGVQDFDRALSFYRALMQVLGVSERFCERDRPWGLRPEYHEHYYGAYFRDTEGNKICVACHVPC